MRRAPRAHLPASGHTLVEVMIALALGLVIVAGAGAMLLGQLESHRRLLVEARLRQDVQLAMDLIIRSLRQRGYTDPGVSSITDWRLSAGVVQMKWEGGNWQSVTDVDVVTVDALTMASTSTVTDLAALCGAGAACLASGGCPRATSTSFELTLTAHAKADIAHRLQLKDATTVRDPAITGACT